VPPDFGADRKIHDGRQNIQVIDIVYEAIARASRPLKVVCSQRPAECGAQNDNVR
jgi:hypothetical protein